MLSLLPLEVAYRAAGGGDDGDYFENLDWCAFLLYLAGDPADVPLLWRAKHTNMDTGGGFDCQSLVGAGVDETVQYLEQRGEQEIVEYIKSAKEDGFFTDLADWEKSRIDHFYSMV